MAEADPRKTFAVDDAGEELVKLLDSARDGDITLTRDGRPIGRLKRYPEPTNVRRQPGGWEELRGKISDEDLLAPVYTDDEWERILNQDIDPTKR